MTFTPPFLDFSEARAIAMDEAQLQQLVSTFHESLAPEIAALQAAFDAGDAERVGHTLHTLKGFLPLFCTPQVGQAFIDLYHQSRHAPLSETRARYESLAPVLVALEKEVRAWLGAL
jgi:hypothetical protein